ncbi:MAG: hypothetical protein NG712_02445 [Omnitrophica bacterium]|nr:hypothetical protein [Candidatus Omnitrophota bacterium]
MKLKLIILLLVSIVVGFVADASADWRSYVWTYEYMTMPQGTKEIEYYLTSQIPDWSEADINTMKHYLEFEYGITDHWDVALYQRFKQLNKDKETDLKYNGFKVRTRYRFGEKDQYILDPLIYLEYIRDNDLSKPNVLEVKLILAKDIGKFNFAYNQIIKEELETAGKTEHEYACGLNYNGIPGLRIGLESKGNLTDEKYYLGPTLSYAFGHKFWTALGVGFGLNNNSDDLQARLIVGVPF